MHAHINWVTRGLYVGKRRIFFNTQIDDVHLATELYQPEGERFRTRPSDMAAHVAWQKSLNARLPAGSNYLVELGHNGNGDIEWSINSNPNTTKCNPDSNIQYDLGPDPPLEFQKPLGTGTDKWPATPVSYTWSSACASGDALAAWFMVPANRNAYSHVSHTFAHENMNNATYSDANKEIKFNLAWMTQMGFTKSTFSGNGLIPPAITGLHNGDVIRAWLDNGIKYVVGDMSRPVLRNTQNEHWALTSTVAGNGYAGLTIVPRWSLPIYYNCADADCTLAEWIKTSGGWGDFNSLLDFSRSTYTRHLLALRHDGFMFHQANMRYGDVDKFTVGTQTDNFSLLQIWVEVIAQEMMRLTTWPLISQKHDDTALAFINRQTLDGCSPNLSWTLSNDKKTITSATLTATGNKCSVPVPVTFPVPVLPVTLTTTTKEQLGSDPLTVSTKLIGLPIPFLFTKAIAV
jgi:hypothetical protein